MRLNIIDEAKKFLYSYLEGKECNYEILHPWRKDAKFIALHSLRVQAYANKIINNQSVPLKEEEKLIIQLAAVLHDIGKIKAKKGHAKISAEIVQLWIEENPRIASAITDKERLIRIIENHSDKETKDEDICSGILKDADLLDEIGVLSIYMSSNRLDNRSPFFFNSLLERVGQQEIEYCNQEFLRLNTVFGKKLMEDKIEFIKTFIDQLSLEIEGTEELYELNKQICK